MSAQPNRSGNRNLDSYIGVHSRVEKFRADHPTARLVTNIVKDEPLTVRCEVYLDGNDSVIPNSSGMADESGGMGGRGNSTLEKVETAAVGRALAFLGYEIKEGIAVREEVQKAALKAVPPSQEPPPAQPATEEKTHDPERRKLEDRVKELCTLLKYDADKTAEAMSRAATKENEALRKTVIPSLERLLAQNEKERSRIATDIYQELNNLYHSDEEITGFLRKNYDGKEPRDMTLAELRAMAANMEIK